MNAFVLVSCCSCLHKGFCFVDFTVMFRAVFSCHMLVALTWSWHTVHVLFLYFCLFYKSVY